MADFYGNKPSINIFKGMEKPGRSIGSEEDIRLVIADVFAKEHNVDPDELVKEDLT
ncbi:hypothetical protein MMC06_006380 [Schaereria dolodes]|nr:hypothetical protein [Schaereria dolodes]